MFVAQLKLSLPILGTVCAMGMAHAQADIIAPPSQMPTLDSTSCGVPVWPIASLRKGEVGTVDFVFLIGADGKVKETKIRRSSGFPALDMAAKQGLEVCRFHPHILNGKAVAAWVGMGFEWKLENDATVPEQKWTAARQRAAGGDAQAEYELAMMYLSLRNEQPRHEMERLLKQAASKQHGAAQLVLGAMSMMPPGTVYSADAAHQFRIAAEQGEPVAEMIYGLLLAHGQGVTQDPQKGIAMLRRTHARGTNSSGAYLGATLMDHAESPDDVEVALKLLQFGAAQGETIAYFKLGYAFETGQGVQQDFLSALNNYSRAASAKFRPAILALASLYERGKGVPADLVRARSLRAQAASL